MAFTQIPLRRSIPAGGLAYFVGYVLTFVITAGRAEIFLSETVVSTTETAPQSLATLLGASPPTTTTAGWLFHNSFQTAIQIPVPNRVDIVGRDLIAAVGGFFLVLYLIPPFVLIVAGYFAARGETPGINGELYAGGATALGFLPLALLGAFVFAVNVNGTTVVVAPDALTSLFAGIAYPVIFGSLGGYLAGRGT